MAATISIEQIIGMCFGAQFFVYGFMAFALYPYNDYYVAQRMKKTESRRYIGARRTLGAVYLLLSITAFLGLHPASGIIGTGGWQLPLVPACLTLFFAGHARMLLGLCDWAPSDCKVHLRHLLPLPVLCAVYAVCPAWGEVVAILQSVHLALLVGYYTPLFYREFNYLNNSCWDAVNETPDGIAEDYNCLPESMPWVGQRYQGLLVITVLGMLAYYLPYGWSMYVVAALFIGYLFWFFYWVFQRFPRFSRTLFFYMNEEDI